MNNIDISPASEEERYWAAGLLSVSEPWITLGRTLKQCLKTCHDPEKRLERAYEMNCRSSYIGRDVSDSLNPLTAKIAKRRIPKGRKELITIVFLWVLCSFFAYFAVKKIT